MNILILGGSGGIGSAIGRELSGRENIEMITATWYRHPPQWRHPKVRWVQVNPSEESAIEDLANSMGTLDWLINAVGFLHDEGSGPERAIKHFEPDFLARNLTINTLPTLLLAKHFQAKLKHERPAIFATVSARVGSIDENQLGGWYSYRASKAALNMTLKTLAIEWRRQLPNTTVAALHPGTVDTALSQPFQRGVKPGKLFTPTHSASCMLELLAGLTPEKSGRFWSWDGSELAW